MNKFALIFAGALSVTYGTLILIKPRYANRLYGIFYDFSEIKLPVAIFFLLFGIALVWLGLKDKWKGKSNNLSICPRCQNVCETKAANRNKCPFCGEQLENLKGFYERHPDMKEADIKDSEPNT